MRWSLAGAALAAAGVLLAGAGVASAQSYTYPVYADEGMEVRNAPPLTTYRTYEAPVYGYRAYVAPPERLPRAHGGCGTYFFWNGERCVDARNR
ncbi:MAG TPA: hypothetical protein VG900_15025 [Hyphomicrobiaceae bacterium]|jgi:hypothetical protein|nr:hypothetical protein [Hyphomicrobiaceae bacterium]